MKKINPPEGKGPPSVIFSRNAIGVAATIEDGRIGFHMQGNNRIEALGLLEAALIYYRKLEQDAMFPKSPTPKPSRRAG